MTSLLAFSIPLISPSSVQIAPVQLSKSLRFVAGVFNQCSIVQNRVISQLQGVDCIQKYIGGKGEKSDNGI